MSRSPKSSPSYATVSSKAANIQDSVKNEIQKLEKKWEIKQGEAASDMLPNALGNLNILFAEAQKITDSSSEINNIQSLLEDIVVAQDRLIIALEHERISYLHKIEENCAAIRLASDSENAAMVVVHKRALEANMKALENMPSIDEYQEQVDGLAQLVQIQQIVNSYSGKDADKFRNSSKVIAAGLENCYNVAASFGNNPNEPQKDYQLEGTRASVLDLSITLTQEGLKLLEDKLKSTTADLDQIKKENSSAKTAKANLAAKKVELEEAIKSKEEDLKNIPKNPSIGDRFLAAVGFKLFKNKNTEIVSKRKAAEEEISILKFNLSNLTNSSKQTIDDLEEHIANTQEAINKNEALARDSQSQINTLRDFSKKLAKDKSSLSAADQKDKKSDIKEKIENIALHKKIGESITSITTALGDVELKSNIKTVTTNQTSNVLKTEFASAFRDELDLARLTRKGLAATTRKDARTEGIKALNSAVAYIPIPGVSNAVSLLLMGAQYLVDKDNENKVARIDGADQSIKNMAEVITLVGQKLAEAYSVKTNGASPMDSLTKDGAKSLAAFAVEKIITELSNKNSSIVITADMTPEQIADAFIEKIHTPNKGVGSKVKGVVAKAERQQFSSALSTVDGVSDWNARGLLEDCGIVTPTGEKFSPANAKAGAKYGYRKGTAEEAQARLFTKVTQENKVAATPKDKAQLDLEIQAEQNQKSISKSVITDIEAVIYALLTKSLESNNVQISEQDKNEKMDKMLLAFTSINNTKPGALKASIEKAIKDATGTVDPEISKQAMLLNDSWKNENALSQAEIATQWHNKYSPTSDQKREAAKQKALNSVKELEEAITAHVGYPKTSKENSSTTYNSFSDNNIAQTMDKVLGAAKTTIDGVETGVNPFKSEVTEEDKTAFKALEVIDKGNMKGLIVKTPDATKEHFHEVVGKYNALKQNLYEAKKLGVDIDVNAEYKKSKEEAKSANNVEAANSSEPKQRRASFLQRVGDAAKTSGAALGGAAGLATLGAGMGSATMMAGGLAVGVTVVLAKAIKSTVQDEKPQTTPEALENSQAPEEKEIFGKHTEAVVKGKDISKQKPIVGRNTAALARDTKAQNSDKQI